MTATPPPSPSPGRPILRLLGGALIEADGVPLGGGAAHRHRLALLALLATNRRPMTRDKLVAYLWPERDTDSARTLLRTALYEIKKLLGDDVIRRTGDAVSIDSSLLRCDVLEFEAAVAANDMRAAAALYAGPFLDGFFIKDASEFEHWADGERARLERLHERGGAQVHDAAPPPASVRVDLEPPAIITAGTAPAMVVVDTTPTQAPQRTRPRRPRIALAVPIALALIVVLIVSARALSKATERTPQPVLLPDDARGSALEFNGTTANASTNSGTVVTTQIDDIAVDMMVNYEGRETEQKKPASLYKKPVLFYNGHGAYSGWGLLMVGRLEGEPDGTIAVYAGGINILATPLSLRRGVWQHLSVERRRGQFTVTLDDKTFAVGALPVTPVGGKYKDIERTTIGGDGLADQPSASFHGAIDRVRIRDLAGAYWIERWLFDEGKGPITVGAKGTVIHIGKATWIPGPQLPLQTIFWSRLESLCGQAFSGQAGDTAAVLYVMGCTPNAIRVGVNVGADRSRTIVLTRNGTNLELLAERHRQEGRLDASARYAAVTADTGSIGAQDFVGSPRADVARLAVDPAKSLSYVIRRDGAERERMQFDLSRRVVAPPAPWGVSP